MNSIKIFLVVLVIMLCYMYGNNIDTFFPQKQNLPFQNTPATNTGDLLMCKDENDVPLSCHGQSVSQAAFNKYKDSSYACPSNWLEPGKSIYQ